jgi:hypothetical protein
LDRTGSSKSQLQHAAERQAQSETTHGRRHGEDHARAGQQDQRSKHSLRQEAKVSTMLYSMSAAFSADEMDLGKTNIVESYIDLRDKEPGYTHQFRIPSEQIKFIKENVMGWLDAGIVKRANSPYNSPIFCVPKKQGHGLRCVLDFRRLNLKTLDSKYSIRCIDQCLEEVGKAGSKIFSCLDMPKGSWNQVLRETDRHFTTFTIPGIRQLQ